MMRFQGADKVTFWFGLRVSIFFAISRMNINQSESKYKVCCLTNLNKAHIKRRLKKNVFSIYVAKLLTPCYGKSSASESKSNFKSRIFLAFAVCGAHSTHDQRRRFEHEGVEEQHRRFRALRATISKGA